MQHFKRGLAKLDVLYLLVRDGFICKASSMLVDVFYPYTLLLCFFLLTLSMSTHTPARSACTSRYSDYLEDAARPAYACPDISGTLSCTKACLHQEQCQQRLGSYASADRPSIAQLTSPTAII